MSISFPLHGSTFSAADSYLSRSGKQHQTEQDSNLLASIRDALRGVATTTVNPNNVREPTRKASFLNTDVDGALEEEITWNDTRVVHTQGRVIKRKWTFEEEGQQIQYACMGWLEQPSQFRDSKTDEGASVNTTSSSNYEASSRPTFGPFHTHHPTSSSESSASSSSISSTTSIRVPAVFIFLRSIGFIYTISSGMSVTTVRVHVLTMLKVADRTNHYKPSTHSPSLSSYPPHTLSAPMGFSSSAFSSPPSSPTPSYLANLSCQQYLLSHHHSVKATPCALHLILRAGLTVSPLH